MGVVYDLGGSKTRWNNFIVFVKTQTIKREISDLGGGGTIAIVLDEGKRRGRR